MVIISCRNERVRQEELWCFVLVLVGLTAAGRTGVYLNPEGDKVAETTVTVTVAASIRCPQTCIR